MAFYNILQIIVVLLTGLAAGLFYSYACSVTGGLGKLSDREYLMAFQSINNVILNAWFFTSFMGSLVVLPAVTWFSYNADINFSFWLFLLATVIYVVGVFGVTIFGNVPLNNMLESTDLNTASLQELFSLRERFEASWNKLTLIRTIAAVVSFIMAVIASILK